MNIEIITAYFTKFSWFLIPIMHVTAIVLLAYVLIRLKRKIFAKLKQQKKIAKYTSFDVFFHSVNKPVTAFIWLLALTFTLRIIESYVEKETFFEWVGPTSRVGMILILAWIGNRFINKTEKEILDKRWLDLHIDKTSTLAIGKLCRVLIYLTVTLIILPTVGIPISGVLALGGVGGIAVGFAAKEMIANFLGGAMLYVERPFLVNDLIELPEKNIMGIVTSIGWRTTKLKLLDRRVMFVPNSTFSVTNVINNSKRTHFRLQETVGIRYEDINCLSQIVADLKAMLKAHPDVDQNDILHVGLAEFNDSSLDCLLWCFINKRTRQDYLITLEDILLKAYKIIEDNGAELAYPTSLVHLQPSMAELVAAKVIKNP